MMEDNVTVAETPQAPPIASKPTYRATVGIDWTTDVGDQRRVEAGETADDFLPNALPWMLAQGWVEAEEG